jgi:N4-gp56 family major capsid protein
LDGTAQLTDNKVPYSGRIAFVSTNFFKLIKQDNSFIKSGDMSQRITLNGEVGMIDGIPIIVVPTSYLPANADINYTHN